MTKQRSSEFALLKVNVSLASDVLHPSLPSTGICHSAKSARNSRTTCYSPSMPMLGAGAHVKRCIDW